MKHKRFCLKRNHFLTEHVIDILFPETLCLSPLLEIQKQCHTPLPEHLPHGPLESSGTQGSSRKVEESSSGRNSDIRTLTAVRRLFLCFFLMLLFFQCLTIRFILLLRASKYHQRGWCLPQQLVWPWFACSWGTTLVSLVQCPLGGQRVGGGQCPHSGGLSSPPS